MPQKKLVLGTFNKDKRREIAQLLKKERVKVLFLKDFPGCRDVVENKNTFAGNAEKKARQYSRHTRLLTLADDSGLMVSALNGKPGVYSARFAGPGCTYEDNNRKLLRLMVKLPLGRRQAKFVCVMALYDNGKRVGTVRGECRGRIAFEGRGKNGFGYDPVFVPDGMKRTFAELRPQEKNKISHRGRALRAARRLIVRHLRER